MTDTQQLQTLIDFARLLGATVTVQFDATPRDNDGGKMIKEIQVQGLQGMGPNSLDARSAIQRLKDALPTTGYFVLNNHTLGYVHRPLPHLFAVIAADVHGHLAKDGPVVLTAKDKLHVATRSDFRAFRVDPAPYLAAQNRPPQRQIMITGTCHFLSRDSAVQYYRNQAFQDPHGAVDQKLKDKEIYIGPPQPKPNQRVYLNQEEGRYFIEE